MYPRRIFYILITASLGLLCVAGLLSLPAFAQSSVPTTSSPSGIVPGSQVIPPAPPGPPSVILYSQYDNPGANSYSSQNFEPANDAYDDFLADDFVVPAGQKWDLNQVDVQGVYYSGPGPARFDECIHLHPGDHHAGHPGILADRDDFLQRGYQLQRCDCTGHSTQPWQVLDFGAG